MREPEWSTPPVPGKNEAVAAAAQAAADAGLTRRSSWVLFAWTTPLFLLLMWGVQSLATGYLLEIFTAMNIDLPAPTKLTLYLMGHPIVTVLTVFGLPAIWSLLIHFLPTDRMRQNFTGLFCFLYILMPAGMTMALILPMVKMQEALRTG